MKISEQIAKGLRLKEMPEEWFGIPEDDEMQNSMTAMAVFTRIVSWISTNLRKQGN